ncbi:MAG: Beta-lactamase [Firmicutes bacterium]|nr:Beta-lactamase [Bacillota bacterium]
MEMHSFLSWLLYSSLMGSILIGLIILLRLLFKNKTDANWQYLLWFLLILKLLIPHAPESSFSVFNIFNQLNMQSLAGIYSDAQEQAKMEPTMRGVSFISQTENMTDAYAVSVSRTFLETRENIIFLIWLTGVIAFTAYTTYLTCKLKCLIKDSSVIKDNSVTKLLEECKLTMNTKKNLVLLESMKIGSPMAVGGIHSYIILPIESIRNLSNEELRFILLHELAHFKRKDLYINWVTVFLQIMHWFNPFIWYAFYQMRQDREVACDAYVLSMLKFSEYKSYGAAIIAFLEKNSSPIYDYTIARLAGGKDHIKKRMAMIASYKRRTRANFIWEILFFLLIGCLVLTDAKSTASATPNGNVSQTNQNIAYEDLSSYFQGYDGTFILLDLKKDRYQIYNDDKSKKRISPNSTYKIISSLVGLETGILKDENTLLEWDKTLYPFERWNRDQTLASAMAYSVNWYFQKVDAGVGKTRIENYLKQIGYGNNDISGGIYDFWVESSLKISPLEQVELLKKLYTYEIPFSQRNIDIVKKAIKISEEDKTTLYGKTGTGIVNERSINGWFVGCVEHEDKIYIFATNIQGENQADGTNAKNITLAILKDKNIL